VKILVELARSWFVGHFSPQCKRLIAASSKLYFPFVGFNIHLGAIFGGQSVFNLIIFVRQAQLVRNRM
jgi:hypothetical protein